VLRSRANRYHLVHHPKFDVFDSGEYVFKEAPNTVHQFVLGLVWREGEKVVELGSGHGRVASALHAKGVNVVATDLEQPADVEAGFPYLRIDLDEAFAGTVADTLGGSADTVLALDVLEHLHRPERALQEIRRVLEPGGRLVASTGNVAYVIVRTMLALGQFNYGKKGILDLTHQRLFTVRSFCRTLEGEGFSVERVRGFGPPIRDMVGKSRLLRVIDGVAGALARLWPSLFGYQFVVEATRLDDVDSLLDRTIATADEAGTVAPPAARDA